MTSQANLDLLFVLAHPDDESFGSGGLISWLREQGYCVGLVCATRGESGQISDPSLGTPETLGAVRERELRTAMTRAGVEPVRLLPYRDSGMDGSPENQDPRSLVQAPREAVLADVIFQLRDLKPAIVITFGPDGIYGHPDHIRIGEIATEAVQLAAGNAYPFLGEPWRVDNLYHSAVAREDLIESASGPHGPIAGLPLDLVATMGTSRAEITHAFDIRPYIQAKLRIMQAHATQLPFNPEPGSPQDPATRPRLAKESLKHIPLPWNGPGDQPSILDRFHSPELLESPAPVATPTT
jgi:LmbE family N-acetylglucosaminyl deacetylase